MLKFVQKVSEVLKIIVKWTKSGKFGTIWVKELFRKDQNYKKTN